MSFTPIFNKSQEFTSSSSWTAPAGVTVATVLLVGGGGAGGGANANTNHRTGGGGGGGQVVLATVPVTPGVSYTITLGAGGTGASAANGGKGGDSSFGTLVYAYGGYGGQLNSEGSGRTVYVNGSTDDSIYVSYGGAGGGVSHTSNNPTSMSGYPEPISQQLNPPFVQFTYGDSSPGLGGQVFLYTGQAPNSATITYPKYVNVPPKNGVLNIAGGGGGHVYGYLPNGGSLTVYGHNGAEGPYSAPGGTVAANTGYSGAGGGSWGAGANGRNTQGTGNAASANTGGGGGGALYTSANQAGGAGGSGYCAVFWQAI